MANALYVFEEEVASIGVPLVRLVLQDDHPFPERVSLCRTSPGRRPKSVIVLVLLSAGVYRVHRPHRGVAYFAIDDDGVRHEISLGAVREWIGRLAKETHGDSLRT